MKTLILFFFVVSISAVLCENENFQKPDVKCILTAILDFLKCLKDNSGEALMDYDLSDSVASPILQCISNLIQDIKACI